MLFTCLSFNMEYMLTGVDGETSTVKFGHHSRAYLEGQTKFWGFWGSSAPPYSLFCTLKSHTFNPIPLDNPRSARDKA